MGSSKRTTETQDGLLNRRELLVLGAAAATTACTSGGVAPASPGGGTSPVAPTKPAAKKLADTVIVGRQIGPRGMDPHANLTTAYFLEPRQVYDALLTWDDTGKEILPQLAAEWKRIDNLTMELRLRDDVKFSNGDAFTAETVKANLERVLDPKNVATVSSTRGRLGPIAAAEVLNSTTVRIKTTAPDPYVLNRLTVLLMAPEKLIRSGANLNQQPVGTGSFKVTEFKPQSHVYLEAWDDSWRGKSPVRVAKIVGIPEMAALIAALQAGDIDIAYSISGDRVADLREQFNTAVIKYDASSVTTIFPTKPGLADKRVRQAFNHAVDPEQMLKAISGGIGRLSQGQIIDPSIEGFDNSIKAYPYDPQKAKGLLKEAGVGDLQITLESSTARKPFIEAVAGYLGAVGVSVRLLIVEPQIFLEHLLGKTDADTISWGAQYWQLRNFDGAAERFAVQQTQRHFPNKQFEELYLKARGEIDADKRISLIRQQIRMMYDEAPCIFHHFEDIPCAFTKKIARMPSSYDLSVPLWKIEKADA